MKYLFKPVRAFILAIALGISLPAFAISAEKLVTDARAQIGKTIRYDPAYTAISYPMGDVALSKGVCTDVVVRALRHQGIDLQEKIYLDMKANFSAYPKKWGLKRPDKNIDHRRVPNIATYFKRQGYSVKTSTYKVSDFKTGDIVTWDLGGGLVHIGIVSDRKSTTGIPLIIHNIGRGTQEENILFSHKITGHFRIP